MKKSYNISIPVEYKGHKKVLAKVQKVCPEATLVTKDRPQSRAERMSEAVNLLADGRSIAEELRDELQNWYDNMPENFQNGDKGSQVQDAISELENAISTLENAESELDGVQFPGMY